jgi:hypothetical protein
MERQASRDAVARYNAEGVAGLWGIELQCRRFEETLGAALYLFIPI